MDKAFVFKEIWMVDTQLTRSEWQWVWIRYVKWIMQKKEMNRDWEDLLSHVNCLQKVDLDSRRKNVIVANDILIMTCSVQQSWYS